jgi:signal transduction histidine kinase
MGEVSLMDLHGILSRQLRKSGLDVGTLPADPAVWSTFLETVNATYSQADKDRYLVERSIEISSREMQSLNAALRSYLESSNESVKESRNQLMLSEKMASLGQLAAGVAHEINNPVSFLISNLDRLSEYAQFFKSLWQSYDELEQSVAAGDSGNGRILLARIEELKKNGDFTFMREDVHNLVLESTEGAYRVKEIVRNLKSFARADEPEMREADLNEGIEATLKMVWSELKYKCNLTKNLGPLPKIKCHPGRLNQVFMNILVNAGQAIPKHGDIHVSSIHEGDQIVVRISDTGGGIPPAGLTKLFTPFFTTKPLGQGTGLGLSISYGIVKNHGGEIKVESEVGKGTTFSVFLPVSGIRKAE